jgi:periplasmic divalent cation tolerance protein
MNAQIIISTYPNRETAEDAAKHFVNKMRLAACVNLIKIKSFYIWKKNLEETEEFLAIFKTSENHSDQLKKEVESRHPYDVPEVAEISFRDLNNKYLKWIIESTIRV